MVAAEYAHGGRPVAAAAVALALGVSHERARALFRRLHELGWLRAPCSPAVPVGGLDRIQLVDGH